MHDIHLRTLDLNLLYALDVLLAERNVTRAAERLGLTQSAMSHALSRLRAALDDPLLVRVPGGMKPTPRATALAQPLSRALAELARAISNPSAFEPSRAKRRFTVATDDYMERILLPKLLARIWREAPAIDVHVTPVNPRLAEDLLGGRIDAIISVASAIGTLPGAYSQRLMDERFVCLMRNGHPLAGRKLTLDQFVSYPHVLVAPAGRAGSVVDTALAKRTRKRRVAVTIPHFLAAQQIVAESDVILTSGERLAKTMTGNLCIARPPVDLPAFTITLFWHERNHADAAHQWFRSVVIDVAKRM